MKEKIINLRIKEADDKSGMGTLYVSKKTGKDSYDCLAVAILNANCCGELRKMVGDYYKIEDDKQLKGLRDYLSRL